MTLNFDKIINCGYDNALEKVIDIRLDRRRVYGNSWKASSEQELLAYIEMKLKRIELTKDNKEKQIDSIIDLINYALFLLENKLEGRNV